MVRRFHGLISLPMLTLACSSDAVTTSGDAGIDSATTRASDADGGGFDAGGSAANEGGSATGCGDTSTGTAFVKSKAGNYPADVTSGGSMTVKFPSTSTFNIAITSNGLGERVMIEQATPTRAVPYQAFTYKYEEAAGSFANEANEVNVFLSGVGTKAIFQCEKATGKLTLAVSDANTPTDFVRLVSK